MTNNSQENKMNTAGEKGLKGENCYEQLETYLEMMNFRKKNFKLGIVVLAG